MVLMYLFDYHWPLLTITALMPLKPNLTGLVIWLEEVFRFSFFSCILLYYILIVIFICQVK